MFPTQYHHKEQLRQLTISRVNTQTAKAVVSRTEHHKVGRCIRWYLLQGNRIVFSHLFSLIQSVQQVQFQAFKSQGLCCFSDLELEHFQPPTRNKYNGIGQIHLPLHHEGAVQSGDTESEHEDVLPRVQRRMRKSFVARLIIFGGDEAVHRIGKPPIKSRHWWW